MLYKYQKSTFLGSLLLLLACFQCPVESRQNTVASATDFSVNAFEFGRFPEGHSPSDHAKGEIKFEALKRPIANKVGYSYGYRIRIKSRKAFVRVLNSSTLIPRDPPSGRGKLTKIDEGAIYYDWPIDGFSNGKYLVKVWLNDVPLPPLHYVIDFH